MSNEAIILQQYKNTLIQERTKQEMLIANWATKLANVDPEVLRGIDLPIEISLKALIPELYKEDIDVDQYNKEYDACVALFDKVNAVAASYNEEAIKCLREFQQIS